MHNPGQAGRSEHRGKRHLVDGVALAVVGRALGLDAVELAHGLALLLLGRHAPALGRGALHAALLHLLVPHALLQALHRHFPLQQRLRVAAHATEDLSITAICSKLLRKGVNRMEIVAVLEVYR